MLRKIILFVTPLLILTVLFLIVIIIINREGGKGALQVTSVPNSEVFLDGKSIGKTPLCLCELPQLIQVGEYDLKLVPQGSEFKEYTQKIKIYQGVLTVVDRTFDKQSSAASGSLITLSSIPDKNKSELMIISFPSGAQVVLDSNIAGSTPLLLENVTASDHEIKVIKDGYREKVVKVKTVPGKRLEATVSLGVRTDLAKETPKASPAASLVTKIVILDTPTGFLRVRESDSLSSAQVTTVSPGEKFDLVSEKAAWYEIKLPDGKTGWVSSEFAKKE